MARLGAYGMTPPAFFADLSSSMRSDMLQLVSCRGYLARGPFDSFESMVYPDRQASQLLLEPQLLIGVQITNLAVVQPSFLEQVMDKNAPTKLQGTASIGGRVNLNLKEPVTNTRMWTRSIELPAETFTFITENRYMQMITLAQAQVLVLNDAGLLRSLIPKLEGMYGRVFTAAENYVNKEELTSVATEAADVRKKASIGVPPE